MSREKQIEELAVVLTDGGCKTCNGCSYNDKFNCKPIYDAELLYNAGYRKQEWISVDERLPELTGDVRTWGDLKIKPSVRVLCTCVQKSGKTFVKEGFYEMWGSRVAWKIPGSIDSVTHWMPLPEVPKMKGGAE